MSERDWITITCTPRERADQICVWVAQAHGFSIKDLIGQDRRRPVALARFEAWAALHAIGWSTPRIGRKFNRDHSTIVHGIQRHKAIALARQEAA